MAGSIDAGSVTDWLYARLDTLLSPTPIGDGIAPEDGGWAEGTPNSASGFTDYFVLKATQSSGMQQQIALCSTTSARFDLGYRLAGYSTSRSGADDLASFGREVLRGDHGPDHVPGADLLVHTRQIWLDQVAGAVRDDQTYPPLWMASTTFRVSVAWIAA